MPKTRNLAKPVCVPCIRRTHPESFSNSSKIQIWITKTNFRGVIFPEGVSPLTARVTSRRFSKLQGGLS
jgi:hypothetical protein